MVERVTLKVKRLAHCKELPRYATAGSAGMDLTAAIDLPYTLGAGQRYAMPTGIIIEIPPGYEGQVRPRSGLAFKAGISLTNCVGTIDSDYRGEVKVLLINHGHAPYVFEPGERIAQLLVTPVPTVDIVEVDELSSAERGAGGFGSTGRGLVAAGNQNQSST
ncbi:MAG: dUTP diphosphatase [Candidatus Obscuribacterales bacterium]|nr:dUTP diphosphatase [Candidatus Obscuribacterales bacterium]